MSVETLAVEAREQLRRVLDGCEMPEVAALRWALLEGRIDGGTFWDSSIGCGCVLGTLAHETDTYPIERWPTVREVIAIESWACPIRPGDKAALDEEWGDLITHAGGPGRAAELVRWIDEWMGERSVSA